MTRDSLSGSTFLSNGALTNGALLNGSLANDATIKSAHTHKGGHDRAAAATKLLSTIKPAQTFLPGSPQYYRVKDCYWSFTQKELNPTCIFQPLNTSDVSLALIVMRATGSAFNVKSGGHARQAGESSVADGVLIDLARLDHVEVSSDRKTVAVGPGLRWKDVYRGLEPLGLTVVGGRDSNVGVGGFLLGGGISFHSSQHGWATENIQSYTVVLADGTVATANSTTNADLYRALRGGGGNLGIVTSFTLDTFPYAGMWGGFTEHAWDHTKAVLEAFVQHGHDSPADPKVSIILNHGTQNGAWIWGNDVQYCAPIHGELPDGLKGIMAIPMISNDTANKDYSTMTIELGHRSAPPKRYSFWALASKLDLGLLEYYVEVFQKECSKILHLDGFQPIGDIQIITSGMRSAMRRRGGNVLGLSDSDEPLLLYNPAPGWNKAADDDAVMTLFQTIVTKVKTRAQELNLDHDFLYMNYTSGWQDPVKSYGEDEQKFLLRTAQKYDPDGVFQKLRSGGFKLVSSR